MTAPTEGTTPRPDVEPAYTPTRMWRERIEAAEAALTEQKDRADRLEVLLREATATIRDNDVRQAIAHYRSRIEAETTPSEGLRAALAEAYHALIVFGSHHLLVWTTSDPKDAKPCPWSAGPVPAGNPPCTCGFGPVEAKARAALAAPATPLDSDLAAEYRAEDEAMERLAAAKERAGYDED